MAILLAIESSCDETAAAIVMAGHDGRPEILSSVIASQIAEHRRYGGVVPEVASRGHSLQLARVVNAALSQAGLRCQDLDAVAATVGPGLASSLLVGSSFAKALAASIKKPFLGINHLEGHLHSPFHDTSYLPAHLALIISGGHTMLIEVLATRRYRLVGSTRDDAAGEAFDKVANMLGLPYPGGPEIERVAKAGNPLAFDLPRPLLHEPSFEFSFSGLKTAVLYSLAKHTEATQVADMAASFQAAVIDILLAKTLRAARTLKHQLIALSGGVSLNGALKEAFFDATRKAGLKLRFACPSLCTDNAAMIALAALARYQAGIGDSLALDIDPRLALAFEH